MQKVLSKTAVVLAIVIIAAGCIATTVPLRKNNYVPCFDAGEFEEYRGTSIYMPAFENRADNTSIWHYYSLDKKRKYQSNNLEQLFWNCFQDAFLHVGVFVYEKIYPFHEKSRDAFYDGIKEFRLQFSSLTDTEFRFIVTLVCKGRIVFQRKFIIPMVFPETEDKALLEQRAFKMIDKTLRTILKDQNFRSAYFYQEGSKSVKAKGDSI